MKHSIIALIETPGVARRLRDALDNLDVEITMCSPSHLHQQLVLQERCDAVLFECTPTTKPAQMQVEADVAAAGIGYLAVVAEEMLAGLQLPSMPKVDFVAQLASTVEYAMRIRRLLKADEEASASDIVTSGTLSINLATYQVKVGDEPIDFTYLEYALLSFLVTHAGRAFSREVLLQRIWGYEYFGGTRTVDVHVRRVRAKLGLELAQHLETVRSVGYLWND